MSARKNVTLSLPSELLDSLDLAARDCCVGRKLLIEMLLTQGLRQLMPADSYLWGVKLEQISPPTPGAGVSMTAVPAVTDTEQP